MLFFNENDPRRRCIGPDLFVGDSRHGADSDFTNRERGKYFPFDAQ